ncbi:MAG: 4-(cytidine 5'-diphospho)-2-C-methyl-D-erythritol kinase [Ruminococcaceae bacterium]|nr:4-(cytidine 5'-diphospho)-2-C-methyl-D-erythritol kinase [Oscillospiraceae bacterium]
MKIKTKAYAKINLILDICGKRTDGFHELFTVMQSVSSCDVVTVEKSKGQGIRITCNDDAIPTDERNIVYKCAKAFFKANNINRYGISIDIDKRIPHEAGLAGGSADGAAVLVALNKLYKTDCSEEFLCTIGAEIGADIPFCIKGGTYLAQGKGEVLSKLKPLPKCYIVLAKPDTAVNTAAAYRSFDETGKMRTPDNFGMLCAVQSRNLDEISNKLDNVFEQFIEVPARVDIKSVMMQNGAIGTCMSGSGPTVFGIFKNRDNAEKSAVLLTQFAKNIIVCTPVSKGCNIYKVIE